MLGIQLPAWSLPELIAVCFCWAVWLIGLSLRPFDPQTQQLVRVYRTVTLAVNLILTSLFLARSGLVKPDDALWWSYLLATTLPPLGMRFSRKLAGQPVLWPEVLYWIISAGCALGLLLFHDFFVIGQRQNPYGFNQAVAGWGGWVLVVNQVAAITWSLADRFGKGGFGPLRGFVSLYVAWMVYNVSALLEQVSTAAWLSLPPMFWLGALALNLEFARLIYWHQAQIMHNLSQANQNLKQLSEELELRVQECTQALEQMALHDSLTGLANRSYAEQRLEAELAQGQPLAVLMIDLDRFKQINDTAGHPVGDAALREVARRFAALVPAQATLARLGGDEFMVLLPNTPEEAQTLSQKLVDSLHSPLKLSGSDFFLGASVGISLFPQHGSDSATLQRLADIAMYRAKEASQGYRVFDAQLDAETSHRIAIEQALRHALRGDPADSFHLEYQPVVELGSGRVSAAEALLRWSHPPQNLGPLGPAQFIPLAEESGLIVKLGDWVLCEACAQVVRWQQQGLAQALVSVNVSVRQFERPDFVQVVQKALEVTGCPPGALALEIIESALIERFEEAALKISQLQALGVQIGLDDFGTGYSSLAYLHRLSFDTVKIDRTFIQGLGQLDQHHELVVATLSIAQSFEMYTVAEGVETAEQAAELERLGCRFVQGWLYAKALPAEQAGQLWEQGNLRLSNPQVPLLALESVREPRG